METNNIIQNMISQHRILQKNLDDILILINTKNPDLDKVIMGLEDFSNNLTGHLTLENNIFYPELLNKLKRNKIDDRDTVLFIQEMADIGTTVNSFLIKYNNITVLDGQINNFIKEVNDIATILNLRIESEESGVYYYWDLYI